MTPASAIYCQLDIHGKDSSVVLLEEDLFEIQQDPTDPTNIITTNPHSLKNNFKETIVEALIDDHFPVHRNKTYIKNSLLQGGTIKLLDVNGDRNCTKPNAFRHQYLECISKGRHMNIKVVPPSEMYQILNLHPRNPPPVPSNRLFPEVQVPASAPASFANDQHTSGPPPFVPAPFYSPAVNLFGTQFQSPMDPSNSNFIIPWDNHLVSLFHPQWESLHLVMHQALQNQSTPVQVPTPSNSPPPDSVHTSSNVGDVSPSANTEVCSNSGNPGILPNQQPSGIQNPISSTGPGISIQQPGGGGAPVGNPPHGVSGSGHVHHPQAMFGGHATGHPTLSVPQPSTGVHVPQAPLSGPAPGSVYGMGFNPQNQSCYPGGVNQGGGINQFMQYPISPWHVSIWNFSPFWYATRSCTSS